MSILSLRSRKCLGDGFLGRNCDDSLKDRRIIICCCLIVSSNGRRIERNNRN